MSNDFLSIFAKPYKNKGFLDLFITPYGQITFNVLKQYCMGAIYSNFDNPIYLSSPVLQDNLTISPETIEVSSNVSLRHTFHHFYFRYLNNTKVDRSHFPLEYIEQGPIFRNEKADNLVPFFRQSYFTVTNLHSFCLDKEQSLVEIKKVFKTIRSFEDDWKVEFKVVCHVNSEEIISVSELVDIWGSSFKVNRNSDEESLIAFDFNLTVNEKTYELCSLEIHLVKIGEKKTILVDFTIGGIERILATVYYQNLKLPNWLAPITAITKRTMENDVKSLPVIPYVRIALAENHNELIATKEKYKIPFVLDINDSLLKQVNAIELKIPKYLKRPIHNNISFNESNYNYDILNIDNKKSI